MRLGLVARADNSGLGNQTYQFYKHMQPAKTVVVDISDLNNNRQFPERYPDADFVRGIPRPQDIDDFLKDLDVVFVAESPYNYCLYTRARERGIKVAVQYNYEFFDWFAYPDYPKPDMLIAPSQWHYDHIDQWCKENGVQHTYLHCPVDRDDLKFRTINKARTFIHIAGKPAAYDRNGTETVIEASKLTKTDANIVIHFQGEQGLVHQATHSFDEYLKKSQAPGVKNLTIKNNELENYADLYKEGDVLIQIRRYGGNCLPMNEALSVGMPVIMPNISPNDAFLPKPWLLQAEKIGQFKPRTVVDIHGVNPLYVARAIDRFYNMSEASMLTQNVRASNLAESISWRNLKYKYIDALESLCRQ